MQTTTSPLAPVAAPAIVAPVADTIAPVANVSNVAPVAAKPAKPAKAKAVKPASAKPAAKPAKPASDTSKRDADYLRAQANRAIVAPHYAGPSPVSHNSVPPKLADALARVSNPVQRAKSATARDDSALALALKHSDKSGTFCPVAATADLGALSRLASLGFLAVRGNRIALTKTGAERARNISRKAG